MELNEIYEYDDGLLLNKKTGHIYSNFDRDGYIRVRREGREYRAHRIIWEMFNGPIPEGMLIDHIDGDTLNNRIENLRLATRQQNNANSVSRVKDMPKGVIRVSKRYRARIYINGKYTSLGMFDTIEEAEAAYNAKAKEIHGEFAKA